MYFIWIEQTDILCFFFQPTPIIIYVHSGRRGDFNCHHNVWGWGITVAAGSFLLSAIEKTNLIILNTGEETIIPNIQQKKRIKQKFPLFAHGELKGFH